MLQKALLTFLSFLFLGASASATNYREDSFEFYSKVATGFDAAFSDVFYELHVQEQKRVLLINGEVITPIEYSDGASFTRMAYQGMQPWDGSSNLGDLVKRTDEIKVQIGDFNGDGYSDQLLQAKGSGAVDGYLVVVYGNKGELPLGIGTIHHNLPGSLSQLKTNSAKITISDVNNDGKSDIQIEYIDPAYSHLPKHAVVYGRDTEINGAQFAEWTNPHAPSYTVNQEIAIKPSNGNVVVGGSTGVFRVNESGAATFTFPLNAPKGPAGMVAPISLAYSSQAPNGPLGKGWAINAGMAITECSSTEYQNLSTNQVSYCLNGSRLVETTRSTSTTKVFSTEIADFSKIEGSFDSDSNKVTNFTITKKDGVFHQFKSIGESTWVLDRTYNPLRSAFIHYEYENVGVTGESYTNSAFSKISIKTAAEQVIAETIFNYENRSDASVVYMDGEQKNLNKRLANIQVKNLGEVVRTYFMEYETSLLSGVSRLRYLQECGQKTECYEPISFDWTQKELITEAYANENFGITGIEQVVTADFNKDGYVDVALRKGSALHIRMGDGIGGWIVPSESTIELPSPDKRQPSISIADVNADGYIDILYKASLKYQGNFCPGASIYDCSVSELEARWYSASNLIAFTAKNIGGVEDFKFERLHFTGYGTETYDYGSKYYQDDSAHPYDHDEIHLIDVNGDTKLDVVLGSDRFGFKNYYMVYLDTFKGEGYSVQATGARSALQPDKVGLFDSVLTTGNYSECSYNYARYSLGIFDANGNRVQGPDARFVDFDNDGYVDILFRGGINCRKASWYIPNTKGWHVAYSPYGDKAGQFEKISSDINEKLVTGDFNGDGFTDIHTNNNLILNKGNGRFVATTTVLPINVAQGKFADLDVDHFSSIEGNADGISDFVITGKDNDTVSIGYNESGKFVFYDPQTQPLGTDLFTPMNGDVNGDGIQDVIVISKDGHINTYIKGVSSLADKTPADVIESITNSSGLKTRIEYGFAKTEPGLYTPDQDAAQPNGTWALDAPVFDVTGAVNLVKRVIDDAPSSSNVNDKVSKRYAYIGGKLQAGGRGFLGFRKLVEIDETFNVKTVTEYAQQFPYQGMPLYTYKVTQSDDFDDSGISSFVTEDVLLPSNQSIRTGFEPISNLNRNGDTTVSELGKCQDTINAGSDLNLTWLSCSRNILNVKEFATKSGNAKYNPVYPYIEHTIEEVFHTKTHYGESGPELVDRGGLLKKIITNKVYDGAIDQFYGDLSSQSIETSILSSDGSQQIAHKITSNFKYEQNDPSQWILGRMTSQEVLTERYAGNYTPPTVSVKTLNTEGVTYTATSRSSSGETIEYTPEYIYTTVDGATYPSLTDYDLTPLANDLTGPSTSLRKTVFDYYDNGLLKSSTVEPENPNQTVVTSYEYDAFGNKTIVIKSSDPSVDSDLQFWRKAQTIYDVNGIFPVSVYEYPEKDGAARLVSTVLDRNSLGLVEATETQNGVRTYKSYDGFGRLTSQWNSIGATRNVTYEFCTTADVAGCNMKTTKTSNSAPAQISYADKLGQTIRSSKVGFDGHWVHVDTTYDKLGRALAVSNPHRGSADLWTYNAYDIFGRVVKTQFPDESTSTVQYDGLYVTTTDAMGLSKARLKNAFGKLVYVKEFKVAGETENILKEVHYKYDVQGNQTEITGDGNTIVTTYDLAGQAIQTNDPVKGIWQYRKNALGELVAQLNANNHYTINVYDDLGRLTNRTIKPLTGGTFEAPVLGTVIESTTWEYDTAEHGLGKLASVTGQSTYTGLSTSYSEVYTYNGFSQLKDKTSTIDGQSYKESWTYDGVGRVETHFDASNGMSASPTNGAKTKYNTNHYVSSITNPTGGGTYFEPLASDVWGNITQYKYGNGVVTNVAYDEKMGRIRTISAGQNENNDEIVDTFYRFDTVGNLDYKTDFNLGYKEDMSYDDTNRLTSVAAQGVFAGYETGVDEYNLSLTYYDNSSNLKTKSNYENGAEYVYGGVGACAGNDCASSVLTSVGQLTFEYDNQGNRLAEKRNGVIEREAQYTPYDKPWFITKGSNYTKFAYGASNQRIKQVSETGGHAETLHYVGTVEWKQKDGEWFFKRRIAGYAIEEQVKNQSTTAVEPQLSYIHKDYQGSVIAISDENGLIKQRFSYDVFGERRNVLYNHATGYIKPAASMYDHIGLYTYNAELEREVALDSRGYTGHEHLDGVGLIHMNGRVYDAASAVFLSADPNIPDATNEYSLNRYSYVLNNPVTYTDPSGYFYKKLKKAVNGVADAIGDGINEVGDAVGDGIRSVGDKAKQFYESEIGKQVIALGITMATGGWGAGWAIAGGFASGYVMTGTLEGAVLGAIFAGASYGIGDIAANMAAGGASALKVAVARATMHGVMGGVRAEMSGGSFASGFKSAAIVSAVGDAGGYASAGIESQAGQVAAAAVIGGTTSMLSGGKFANGAITAAFVHAYNHQNEEYHKENAEMSVSEAMGTMSKGDASEFAKFVGDGVDMTEALVNNNPNLSIADKAIIMTELRSRMMGPAVQAGLDGLSNGLGIGLQGASYAMPQTKVFAKVMNDTGSYFRGETLYKNYDVTINAEVGNSYIKVRGYD